MTDAGSRVYDGNTVSGPSSCEEPCAEGEDWTRVGADCYLLSPDMMGWHAAQQVPTSNISLVTYLYVFSFVLQMEAISWKYCHKSMKTFLMKVYLMD